MTIYTEFKCGKLPKRKDIISHLESSGYAVSTESKQALLIRKTFEEGKLIFSKNRVVLKVKQSILILFLASLLTSLSIFYFSYLLLKSDIIGTSGFYYLIIVSVMVPLVIYEGYRDRLLLSIERALGQGYKLSWKNFLSIIALLLFTIAYILVSI